MKEYDPRFERLTAVLFVRGWALLAFAAIALRWPERSLADAVRYAGGVAVFLGIVELGIALAGHALLSTRAFRVGHALVSIGFGVAAGLVMRQPPGRGLSIAAVWLGTYTAFLLLLAARVAYARRFRNGLLAWSALNAGGIIVCLQLAGLGRATVLLAGALYTAALGAVTITAARWLRGSPRRVARVAG